MAPALPQLVERPLSHVDRFLREHKLEQYIDTFAAEGFEDMDDLVELCRHHESVLTKIIPSFGQRANFLRLIHGTEMWVKSIANERVLAQQKDLDSASLVVHTGNNDRHPLQEARASVEQQKQSRGAQRQKILVVGACNAGKSTLIASLKGHFHTQGALPVSAATIGFNVTDFTSEVGIMHLWDCGGQFTYFGSSGAQYTALNGVIVVADCQRLSEGVEWKSLVQRKAANVPFFLFANKIDLCSEREIREVRSFGEGNGFALTVPVSARNRDQVQGAFRAVQDFINALGEVAPAEEHVRVVSRRMPAQGGEEGQVQLQRSSRRTLKPAPR